MDLVSGFSGFHACVKSRRSAVPHPTHRSPRARSWAYARRPQRSEHVRLITNSGTAPAGVDLHCGADAMAPVRSCRGWCLTWPSLRRHGQLRDTSNKRSHDHAQTSLKVCAYVAGAVSGRSGMPCAAARCSCRCVPRFRRACWHDACMTRACSRGPHAGPGI